MYAWALKKLERENGDENGLLAQERGKDIRRVLGPALFSVRFPCIDLDVIREKIGDLYFQ
jgi:hypothetical protein